MASVSKRAWTHKGQRKEAWTVRYLDGGGVHRQKTFERKKEADIYKRKAEDDLASGTYRREADRVTVKQLADEFERAMTDRQTDGRIGKSHLSRTMNDVRLHILPRIGRLTLADLTLDKLIHWNRTLRAEKTARTAVVSARVLRTMLDYAVRRKWIVQNPVKELLAEVDGLRRQKIATFTREEMLKVIEAAEARAPHASRRSHAMIRCAVHLAAICGMRKGEILGLRRQDINFERSIIHIRRSLSSLDGLKSPKSRAGVRELGMPQHVGSMLNDWLLQHRIENDDDLVFTRPDGSPQHPQNLHSAWGYLLKRAGLAEDPEKPSFHFHAMRHFAASWRIDAGWSVADVMRDLGHANFDVTLNIYTHVLDRGGARVSQAQALSDRLLPAPALLPPPSACA